MTLGQFREMTQYLSNSVELNIAYGDEYFPVNCFVGRGNTLALSPGGYDKMVDAENTFVALARLGRENFAQQYLNTPKVNIPITEEWLAKQGFKREYDCICEYTYYIQEIDGYFVEVKIGCSNMGDEHVNCHIDNCDRNSVASADIQYVHQLQNLLNIMNIKLDIKL